MNVALLPACGAKGAPVVVPAGAQAGDLVGLEPCTYEANKKKYDADCGTLVVPVQVSVKDPWPLPLLVLVALLFILLLPIKVAMYFSLFSLFCLRASTSWHTSLNLANYSEFGLIVGAIGVSAGLLGSYWLSVLAIALAISFLIAAPLNAISKTLYQRWRHPLHRFERRTRLPGDEVIRPGKAQVVVFGMGRVGTGAYDYLRAKWGDVVLGIDIDEKLAAEYLCEESVEQWTQTRLPDGSPARP